MVDGIKIYYRIKDFEAWKRAVKISLSVSVENETGAVKEKIRRYPECLQRTITYRGVFETFYLTIKETIKTVNGETSVSHLLCIDGSLHKNHFNGTNYLDFTWGDLQYQGKHIEQSLWLDAENCELVNLEFGVNIETSFPAFQYLEENLISYKGNSFSRYKPDSEGICLGYYCDLAQYSVKVYDKGKQNNLPYNLMRFELRFVKMQKLKKKGIKHLSDLFNQKIVFNLIKLLIDAWDNILFYDSSINIKTLQKSKEKELLINGSNPKFWERLKKENSRRFNHNRNRFKNLIATHGKNVQENLRNLIIKEWQNLFEKCTNLLCGKKEEMYKFTVKVKCKNVHKHFATCLPQQPNKRYCISCGRDISNQNSRSRFCSAKYVGEAAAHKCRNTNSNPRNNLKNKVKRINSRGVLFDIVPFISWSKNISHAKEIFD